MGASFKLEPWDLPYIFTLWQPGNCPICTANTLTFEHVNAMCSLTHLVLVTLANQHFCTPITTGQPTVGMTVAFPVQSFKSLLVSAAHEKLLRCTRQQNTLERCSTRRTSSATSTCTQTANVTGEANTQENQEATCSTQSGAIRQTFV